MDIGALSPNPGTEFMLNACLLKTEKEGGGEGQGRRMGRGGGKGRENTEKRVFPHWTQKGRGERGAEDFPSGAS